MLPPRFPISKELAVILGGLLLLFFVTLAAGSALAAMHISSGLAPSASFVSRSGISPSLVPSRI